MTDKEKIEECINFDYIGQGYVDLSQVVTMTGIPAMVVKNVLYQNGFIESGIKGQYIKG